MANQNVRLGEQPYDLRHHRFTNDDGWSAYDLSTSPSGNIAVSGGNHKTKKTFIDVYVVENCSTTERPRIFYSTEFRKYNSNGLDYWERKVSFVEHSHDTIVTCVGQKLEMINVRKGSVLKSFKMIAQGTSLFVRGIELFVTLNASNKIEVHSLVNLNKIKMVTIDGISSIKDAAVAKDNFLVCLGDDNEDQAQRSIRIDEESGRVLSRYTNISGAFRYASAITVNEVLGVVAVLWLKSTRPTFPMDVGQICFYPVRSENNFSFLRVEVEAGVTIIKLSHKSDRMVTLNKFTGKMKVYDFVLAELFNIDRLKLALEPGLQKNDCSKLAQFFHLSEDQQRDIAHSNIPARRLLGVLQENGVMQPTIVDKLIEAFMKLNINSTCCNVLEIYQRTRTQSAYKDHLEKLKVEIQRLNVVSERKIQHVEEYRKGEIQRYQNVAQDLMNSTQKNNLAIQQAKQSQTATAKTLTLCANFKDQEKEKLDQDRSKLSTLRDELTNVNSDLIRTIELLRQKHQVKEAIHNERQQSRLRRFTESVGVHEAARQGRSSESQGRNQPGITFISSLHSGASGTRYLHESVIEAEFQKLVVAISEELTLDNCVFLATLFRFPAAIVDYLRNVSRREIPGMKLFDILLERNIINMYDICNLHKGLEILQLEKVIDTLIIPYERKIDPRIRDQHRLPMI